jgi:hypothetical protein
MADLEQTISTYCDAWGESDPGRRRALLATVWADDGTYTDPTVHLVGVDALVAHITTVLAKRPGAVIERTTAVDGHHAVARFGWRVVLADGRKLPEGIDFVELTDDGKISRIVGFFGAMAPRS